jgi:hypothetical protein
VSSELNAGGSWATAVRRLPRPVFWLAGGLVACTGAFVANRFAAGMPVDDRLPWWLAGSVAVFAGLAIVSLGTRARAGRQSDQPGE